MRSTALRAGAPEAVVADAGVRAFASDHLGLIDDAVAPLLASAARLGERYRSAAAVALGMEGVAGRRWRPLLVLATARAMDRSPADLAGLAAAVELTHTASLVLDDLPCMDDSAERRGEDATHVQVGAEGAILLAVACLGAAARLLGAAPAAAGTIAGEWGEMVGLDGMAGGQAMDLMAARVGAHTGAARRLHRRKSTALPAFALAAAARALEAEPVLREDLRAYGRYLGWAYQLADDARDRLEDGRRGLPPGGRCPARQSDRLLRRARRRLERTSLCNGGRTLLLELGDAVVAGRPLHAGRAA